MSAFAQAFHSATCVTLSMSVLYLFFPVPFVPYMNSSGIGVLMS